MLLLPGKRSTRLIATLRFQNAISGFVPSLLGRNFATREGNLSKFVDAAYTVEIGRVRTLFWVPDVITDPHAIHPNAHPVVAGDEVYVKRYDKNGSEVKLVVMGPSENRGRVIITSFLTDISDLGNYIKEAAIWTKK